MIAWVKTQDEFYSVGSGSMRVDINEAWYTNNCSLCEKYHGFWGCSPCPLGLKYGRCGSSLSYRNKWSAVNNSYIWRVWLKNAKKFLRQLKSLEVKNNLKGGKK